MRDEEQMMNERWRTNRDKTNAAFETTDTHAKKNCNWETALEWSEENYYLGLN